MFFEFVLDEFFVSILGGKREVRCYRSPLPVPGHNVLGKWLGAMLS